MVAKVAKVPAWTRGPRHAAEAGKCGLERALLDAGVDPLTADRIVTGHERVPGVKMLEHGLTLLDRRISGLRAYREQCEEVRR